MTIYNWLTNTHMESYHIGIWSLFINFLIQTFYSALHSFFLVNVDFNESVKILIYVLTAVVSSVIVVKIINCNLTRVILDKIGKKTVHEDIFDDVIDYAKRTIMVVYLKDSDIFYTGSFKLKEEKGSDSYITLINYVSRKISNGKVIINSAKSELNSSVVINLHDVQRIEMIYEEDSKIWEWLNKGFEENPKIKGDSKNKEKQESSK